MYNFQYIFPLEWRRSSIFGNNRKESIKLGNKTLQMQNQTNINRSYVFSNIILKWFIYSYVFYFKINTVHYFLSIKIFTLNCNTFENKGSLLYFNFHILTVLMYLNDYLSKRMSLCQHTPRLSTAHKANRFRKGYSKRNC